MPLSPRTIRNQLSKIRPLLNSSSLESIRRGQNMLGELMEAKQRRQVIVKHHTFDNFEGAWIIPKDERRQGVILYLHGGGYTCGNLEYAKGFGSVLTVQCGVKVFCAAYRLAPEHRYPAALEDALEAYQYLLSKGYTGRITLCGESAGGGLCYALCMKLRQLQMPQPCGIIAISPWTDMTASGSSYADNQDSDPTMTIATLDFYASHYTDDRADPLVSPLLGDVNGLPPSLIFVCSDEIMFSDAQSMHLKLLESGCVSRFYSKSERWHAYLLYCLPEDQNDFAAMNRFLNQYMSVEHKLRWMRLDNAAKMYPAVLRSNWSNTFRLSATLRETVDVDVLQAALDVTVRRFPSIAARLRKGLFWYYLQQLHHAPQILQESCYPLVPMRKKEIRTCAFRVIVYNRRIAVEFFHCLTDGNGAMVFLKTLLAEYLQQKYNVDIPAEHGVLGRLDEPSAEELEDSFQKYAGPVSAKRRETDAWHMTGTISPVGFQTLTCFQIPLDTVLEKSREYGVSLTTFLCAALMMALQKAQMELVPDIRKRKHIKVLIPVNLRKIFPSKTLRNFVLFTIPQIDPRLGEHSFEEICGAVRHQMGLDITPKRMSARIAANVSSERPLAVKVMPLFIKNAVLRAVLGAVGERKSCMSISNLGVVTLPEEMIPYVERMDFVLGVLATAPSNCAVLSYKNTLYINIIRKIEESTLERNFFCVLRDMGIPVEVQSNQ